jgi:hypothetical protein
LLNKLPGMLLTNKETQDKNNDIGSLNGRWKNANNCVEILKNVLHSTIQILINAISISNKYKDLVKIRVRLRAMLRKGLKRNNANHKHKFQYQQVMMNAN